ncbi:hypothetical protein [Streptomyces sp. NPDC056682]|uniref:hypothetical protein n=1 Tax=Streptomyces sp. NPDC056682 TaxID=3345909 RepID=UPI0036C3E661
MDTAIPSTAPAGWPQAVRRASKAAGEGRLGEVDENCWDDVAIRDIIATVLYALHRRDGQPVDRIPWGSVLWQLWSDERVIALVEQVLPCARDAPTAADGQGGGSGGEPLARWRWLNRTWDPKAPVQPRSVSPSSPWHREPVPGPDGVVPEPRWGGMSRGIGSDLAEPAIEVCVSWAAGAVETVISAESHGYATHQRVHVTGGRHDGAYGYVMGQGWAADDDRQEVIDGPPVEYTVSLDEAPGTVEIDAEHLTDQADGLSWPHRAPDSPALVAPRGLDEPPPPMPSCSEDLAAILARASNPEVVSEELRRTIGSSTYHHHLALDRQAMPRPQRLSWQLVMHWYQAGEDYAEDQRASLWEITFTTHLRDPCPVSYLALSEEEAQALIARRPLLSP